MADVSERHTMDSYLIPIIVGITGHRDLRGEDKDLLSARIREIFVELRTKYPGTPLLVLSALADGADRLVADIALEDFGSDISRGSLVVTLPMSREEYEKDFDADSRTQFDTLMARAYASFELPLVEGNNAENIKEYGEPRDRQYEQSGVFIAFHSQVLIALWDGVELDLIGGTSQIVKHRLAGITAKDHDPLGVVDKGPVFHILTPRRKSLLFNGEAGSRRELFPLSGKSDGKDAELARLTFEEILSRISDFNLTTKRLAPRLADEIAKNKNYLIPDEQLHHLSEMDRHILDQFALADTLAIYYQKWSRRVLFALFLIAVLAIIFFESYSGLFPEPWVLAAYPALLGVGYITYKLTKRWNIQSKFLDYRALAEGLRVQLFWRLAGLGDEVVDHYLRKQHTELDWIRNAIRVMNLPITRSRSDQGSDTHNGDTLSHRLRELVLKHWVNDQLNYFRRSSERDSSKLRNRNLAISLFFGAGLLLAVGVVFIHTTFGGEPWFSIWQNRFNILMAVAPAVAAALGGYAEKMAFSAHSKRYLWMSELFSRAAQAMELHLPNNRLEEAQELLRDLGKEALLENGDWILIHREREIEVPRG